MTTRRRRELPWQVWAVGMWAGVALTLLAALGEWLGWWHDAGIVLGFVGIVLSVVFGMITASSRSVQALRTTLDGMADDLSTIKVVLERIAVRLGA